MLVVCKDNEQMESQLQIGQVYFVEEIKCYNNQFYYKLSGVKQICSYFRFNLVSKLRQDKLKELGI